MRIIAILLIAIITIVYCQDTTTSGTSSNAFATAITAATTTAATGSASVPPPPSKPDHRPWYIKLRDLGVLNLIFIGIGGVLLLLCIYGCTCFDSRKPPLDYNDIGMTKVK